MSLDQEAIDNQLALLTTHRRTLAHLLQQAAQFGGEVFAPPQTANGIAEARAEIRRIKSVLRKNGVQIENEPNDARPNSRKQLVTLSKPTKESQLPVSRPLRVFLCHSRIDKPNVRNLYQRLRADGFQPWLDEEELIGGQDWDVEIAQAVRDSDIVVVCLSRNATSRTGYVHREIKYALDIADQQPEGTVFIIPVRLEECEVPERLRRWQWINLFDELGYERLVRALRHRAKAFEFTEVPVQSEKSLNAKAPESTEHSPSLPITAIPITAPTASQPNSTQRARIQWNRNAFSQIVNPVLPFIVIGGVVILIGAIILWFINSSVSLFPNQAIAPSAAPSLTSPASTVSALNPPRTTTDIPPTTPTTTLTTTPTTTLTPSSTAIQLIGVVDNEGVQIYENAARAKGFALFVVTKGSRWYLCSRDATYGSYLISKASCSENKTLGWINERYISIRTEALLPSTTSLPTSKLLSGTATP